MSSKQSRGPTPAIRRQVIARDLSTCQWCGRHVRTDSGWYSLQHRRARGMGGTRDAAANLPANLVLVCGTGTTECHGQIEGAPAQALARGFRISSSATPARVPYMDWTGREWLLTDDGGKLPAPERQPVPPALLEQLAEPGPAAAILEALARAGKP